MGVRPFSLEDWEKGERVLSEEIILKAESISKSFGGVKALQNVSFELKRGEVLSVIGENGAVRPMLS